MHLSEGVLQSSTLLVGATFAVVGVAIGLKKMNYEHLSLTALLASAFFVASTIHIPVGIGSVHLILNGIAGLLLGWSVFPAFLVALILQALLFSFGGFSVLGINLCVMALPALAVHYIVSPILKRGLQRPILILAGTLSGIIGVGGAALIASIILIFNGEAYTDLIGLLLVSHLPVFVIDSLISVGVLLTLSKMLPEVLCKNERIS
ncbi:cobalamin biosynthesis protein CbiM [Pasteurellaceae bacterium LFhippo2]|nr:cobalamin biosynthesis protein CbiM [Pasteurellaceae bacterium LFhippo2]